MPAGRRLRRRCRPGAGPVPARCTGREAADPGLNLPHRRTDPFGVDLETPRPLRDLVEVELDRLRPALTADGGNVELVSVDPDGTVRIALQGACATCPAQLATVRVGLEEPLRRAIPGIAAVIAV